MGTDLLAESPQFVFGNDGVTEKYGMRITHIDRHIACRIVFQRQYALLHTGHTHVHRHLVHLSACYVQRQHTDAGKRLYENTRLAA